MHRHAATIRRFIDGDTVEVMLDHDFRVYSVQKLRVRGINCPEARGPERDQGKLATGHANGLAAVGSNITVTSYGEDKYGRWISDLTLPDGRDFAAEMIAAGRATPADDKGNPR